MFATVETRKLRLPSTFSLFISENETVVPLRNASSQRGQISPVSGEKKKGQKREKKRYGKKKKKRGETGCLHLGSREMDLCCR